MFDELYRKRGTLKIPTCEYLDGQPVYTEAHVRYFASDSSFRDPQNGALKRESYFMLKAFENETFPEIQSDSKFMDESGEIYDIRTVKHIVNHFNNVFEALKITMV